MHSSYKNMVAITPDNATLLTHQVAEIMVAVGGTVTVLTAGGQTVQFTAVAGFRYPIIAKRINSTGTAATGIIGLY
jgi:hypothetical protein